MNDLTKNEEILLISVLRLKENAYGVSIKKRIKEITKKDWNYGTLYCTLDQLVKKGLLEKQEGKPMSERGGRRKIFYTVSSDGMMALKNAHDLQLALWQDIYTLVFGEGG